MVKFHERMKFYLSLNILMVKLHERLNTFMVKICIPIDFTIYVGTIRMGFSLIRSVYSILKLGADLSIHTFIHEPFLLSKSYKSLISLIMKFYFSLNTFMVKFHERLKTFIVRKFENHYGRVSRKADYLFSKIP